VVRGLAASSTAMRTIPAAAYTSGRKG
jgi:hypothetical protein